MALTGLEHRILDLLPVERVCLLRALRQVLTAQPSLIRRALHRLEKRGMIRQQEDAGNRSPGKRLRRKSAASVELYGRGGISGGSSI